MRARATISGVLAAMGILTAAWELGASTHTPVPTTTTSPAGESGSRPSSSPSPASTDGTWTGAAVSTRFGTVQVQATISGGAITEVSALHLTDADGKSIRISNQAAPVLRSEVLAAQSASVSIVSGATYTSRAYLDSLQSALDQAGWP